MFILGSSFRLPVEKGYRKGEAVPRIVESLIKKYPTIPGKGESGLVIFLSTPDFPIHVQTLKVQ
jgi:hypothetical protein